MNGMVTRVERTLLAGVLVTALVVPAAVEGQQKTSEVAAHYLDLTLNQRFEELLEIYAPNAVFFDPTAEVFQGPVGQGPLRGAEAIVAMEKSWGIQGSQLDVAGTFAVGSFALFHGRFKVRYGASQPWIEFPFVTVLGVRDGHVFQRTDFAEYVKAFGLGDRFDADTERTREVAARYLQAYYDADLETQAELLAPDARFQDQTAQVYGPNAGQPMEGRETIIGRRRTTFQNVKDFGLDVDESFASNHHAVFIGTTHYTLANGARYKQPAVFVVEVRNNLVTHHWDFVDYSVGPVGP
jgi:ketosteroid isomerase-like protein